MKVWTILGLGLTALALLKFEKDQDGKAIALSPILAALALEAGVILLRRRQSRLLASR